ncbi:MAG: hypothetical protein PHY47_26820 [Lachnospiraceae bacterium]|nr:hypothetical protein [Lachnospiraceae bacterium]
MNNKDNYDKWYVGFVGFLCSFGSKFFGGYARGKNNSGDARNYAMESYNNLNKQSPNLRNHKKNSTPFIGRMNFLKDTTICCVFLLSIS